MSHEATALADAVLTVLDHIVYRARSLGMVPAGLPTRRNRRFSSALALLDQTVYGLIAERRRNGAKGPDDLLAMLMAAQDQDQPTGQAGGPAQMSDRQLRDEIMTLLIAGHETVASALAWTLYLISQDREAEAGLQAEAARSDPSTLARTGAPTFTRMVFDETLRLYPPAWLITRRALAPDELGGYPIPSGALVVLSPYAMHRHPAFWEDPDRFDPQRFSAGRSASRPRFAYFPFGGGPRLCIGNTFALVEAQVVLASIARAYRLELVPGQTIVPEASVTLRPRHGLLMVPKPIG
jgi:cytochrome P450